MSLPLFSLLPHPPKTDSSAGLFRLLVTILLISSLAHTLSLFKKREAGTNGRYLATNVTRKRVLTLVSVGRLNDILK